MTRSTSIACALIGAATIIAATTPAFACCKETFVRTKPHVNVATSGQTDKVAKSSRPLKGEVVVSYTIEKKTGTSPTVAPLAQPPAER